MPDSGQLASRNRQFMTDSGQSNSLSQDPSCSDSYESSSESDVSSSTSHQLAPSKPHKTETINQRQQRIRNERYKRKLIKLHNVRRELYDDGFIFSWSVVPKQKEGEPCNKTTGYCQRPFVNISPHEINEIHEMTRSTTDSMYIIEEVKDSLGYLSREVHVYGKYTLQELLDVVTSAVAVPGIVAVLDTSDEPMDAEWTSTQDQHVHDAANMSTKEKLNARAATDLNFSFSHSPENEFLLEIPDNISHNGDQKDDKRCVFCQKPVAVNDSGRPLLFCDSCVAADQLRCPIRAPAQLSPLASALTTANFSQDKPHVTSPELEALLATQY
ncbi:hypothetical protein P9112_010032 [Eukaryota sp. TZLM1-RC]